MDSDRTVYPKKTNLAQIHLNPYATRLLGIDYRTKLTII